MLDTQAASTIAFCRRLHVVLVLKARYGELLKLGSMIGCRLPCAGSPPSWKETIHANFAGYVVTIGRGYVV